MGFLKDILLGNSGNETPAERTERIDVRGSDESRDIYDGRGHWKEEHRWNPRTDRWDKLDSHGNVTGHIERDSRGNMVHRDYFENVTQVDRRDDYRTVSHYDSRGRKTGYTTKNDHNRLTRHTYTESPGRASDSRPTGFLLYDLLKGVAGDTGKKK